MQKKTLRQHIYIFAMHGQYGRYGPFELKIPSMLQCYNVAIPIIIINTSNDSRESLNYSL